jgi:hypothetical protein
MGLPTSWCYLSLIHLFWIDQVRRTSRGRDRLLHKHSICGDDAVLATTLAGAAKYKEIVGLCRGLPSEGKHYECGPGCFSKRCVFLEKLFEFNIDAEGLLQDGLLCPAIPVRGLTSHSLARDMLRGDKVLCTSDSFV